MARAGCLAVAFLADTRVIGMLGIHMRNCLAAPASIFGFYVLVFQRCFNDFKIRDNAGADVDMEDVIVDTQTLFVEGSRDSSLVGFGRMQ